MITNEFGKRRSGGGSGVFYAIIIILAIALIGFRIYWENTFGGVVVDGASMNKTLQSKDKLLMKYLKDADDLKRGDVIVVRVREYEEFKGSGTEYLIKRLIAVEGDKVRCNGEQVEICYAGTDEYVVLEEPYAYYGNTSQIYQFSEYEVGKDEIFFLGDNRTGSLDARYWSDPYVPVEELQARPFIAISVGKDQSWQGVRFLHREG